MLKAGLGTLLRFPARQLGRIRADQLWSRDRLCGAPSWIKDHYASLPGFPTQT